MMSVSNKCLEAIQENRLQIISAWLSAMHEQGILYCHFKSNNRVFDGLTGTTDLDILIDRNQYIQAIEVLSRFGFKRFCGSEFISYPAVEDFLGFDQATGKLVHLHLHWQMIAGEPHIKGFRMPWERLLLDTRKWDEKNRIFVASPEVEIILLVTRAVMKIRHRDRLRFMLRRTYFRGSMIREFEWLSEVADHEKVSLIAQDLLGNETAEVIKKVLINRKIVDRDIFTFRKAAMPTLRRYKSYSNLGALVARWLREIGKKVFQAGKRFGRNNKVLRRSPAAGGIVVALLGADGSGKSTHAHGLCKWLNWKADVMCVYLGSGSGSRSLSRRLLDWVKLLAYLARRSVYGFKRELPNRPVLQRKTNSRGKPGKPLHEKPVLQRAWIILWSLVLAKEKLHKIQRAFRARNRGMIIIADRYPQNQIKGYNDGPLLDDLKNLPGLWNYARRIEAGMFNKMLMLQPDLVVKLDVSLDTALDRKKDSPPEMVQRKIEAIRQLDFSPQTKVVIIDGTVPLEQVSLEVKQAVWECL